MAPVHSHSSSIRHALPKLHNFAAVEHLVTPSHPSSAAHRATQSFPATVTRLRAPQTSWSTKPSAAHSTVTRHNAAVAQKPLEASTSTSTLTSIFQPSSSSALPTTLVKALPTTPPGGAPASSRTSSRSIPPAPPLLTIASSPSALASSLPPSTASPTFLRSPASASAAPQQQHISGVPTSTFIGIGVAFAFLVTCIIVFLVKRRVKREEKRLLGEGGKWQNLEGKKGGRKGEKLTDDGESFVWGNQAYADNGGYDASQPAMGIASSGMTTEAFDEKTTYYPQHPHEGYQLSDVQPHHDTYQEQPTQQSHYHQPQQAVSALNQRPPSAYNSMDPYAPAIQSESPKYATPARPIPPSHTPSQQHYQQSQGNNTRSLYAPDNHHAHQSSPPKPVATAYTAPSALFSQQGPRSTQPASHKPPVRKPSYVNTNSLHPSHAVTHHPPPPRSNGAGSGGGRSRTKTAAVPSGGASEQQDNDEAGVFGSLMLRDFDQDGAIVPAQLETPDLSRSINRKPVPTPYDGLLSPSPSQTLSYDQPSSSSSFRPRQPTNNRLSANGFVPLDQMRADGGNYRSPIESIFESYEGEQDWETGRSPDPSARRGGDNGRLAGYLHG